MNCLSARQLNYGILRLGSSLSKNTIVWTETSCAVMSHCLHICMGKFILCLKAHGSCNQVQNDHKNYEFN